MRLYIRKQKQDEERREDSKVALAKQLLLGFGIDVVSMGIVDDLKLLCSLLIRHAHLCR